MINKLKFILRLILFVTFCLPLLLKAQVLSKIRPITSRGNDVNWAIAKDSKSNFYMSFSMHPSIKDSVNIHNELFYDSLMNGTYLVKLDANRKLVWLNKTSEFVRSIDVLSNDDVITTGGGTHSFYISRLAPDGTKLWEIREGTTSSMHGLKLLIDKSDNIYVTGNVNAWEVFGLRINNESCCSDHDFLAKFNPDGDLDWIIASSPNDNTIGRDIAFDKEGNILLIGQFYYSMNLGGHSLSSSFGYSNSYLACISPSGNVKWLKGFGEGEGNCRITQIEVGISGNIFFGGVFTRSVQIQDTILTSKGFNDVVFGNFDSEGNLSWIKQFGTDKSENINDLVLSNGNMLIAAHTEGNLSIDDHNINGIEGKSFILKSNLNGLVLWTKELAFSNVERVVYNYPLNNRILITEIEGGKYFLFGSFITEVVDVNKSFQARSQDLFTAILVEDCPSDQEVIISDPDINISICSNEQVNLQLTNINPSDSIEFTLMSGEVLFNFQDSILNVLELLSDTAVFKIKLENCISEDFQLISLFKKEKPLLPVVTGDLDWCNNDLIDAQAVVDGEEVKWYDSESLTNVIEDGKVYDVSKNDTLFVTQTINGCESFPLKVVVNVHESPVKPILDVSSFKACINSNYFLKPLKEEVNWYDSNLEFLQFSDSLDFFEENLGTFQFAVSSKNEFCESQLSSLEVEVINYNESEVFIANAITPNGDGINDYFYLKSFSSELCLGGFKRVVIIDRSGQEIFGSKNRKFKWYPNLVKTGVYYYLLEFERKSFKGPISILY